MLYWFLLQRKSKLVNVNMSSTQVFSARYRFGLGSIVSSFRQKSNITWQHIIDKEFLI